MDNKRYLNSAFCAKLFFSAVFCVFGAGVVPAQSFDTSIFVIDTATSPSVVVQAWRPNPVQFTVRDVFFSSSLGRYLGQNGTEVFAATVNLVSNGTVVYTEGLGNLSFKQNGFSFVLGKNGLLMPTNLRSPNLILQLVLPSQTATFAMTALPYAVHARIAERGLAGLASDVSGNFVSTFSVQTGLVVTQNKLVVRGARLGLGTFSPGYTVDVAGIANFTDMYLNGRPLSHSMSWLRSTVTTANIYTTKFPVGIRTAFPSTGFSLHVAATVNATHLTRNGNPLTASNFWVKTTEPTYNLYILSHQVGIGRATPQEKLDVNGGLRLDTNSSGNTGTIRWASVGTFSDFQGYLSTGFGTEEWRSLTGILGTGRADRVARWAGPVSPPSMGSVADLIHNSGIGLGVGVTPVARLQVAGKSGDTGPVFLASSSANIPLLQISATGSLGIGTTLSGHRVEVMGTLNAQDLLINGVPLRLTLSKSTYWLRNSKNSLYYMQGNVGIGRPDPTSLLEIAAPNRFDAEPTKNPAITFTAGHNTTSQQRYTMGVNAQQDGVFRVEKGTSLGGDTPLFVALEDRFGVGLANPQANLHVSGNLGLLLTGRFEAVNPGISPITATVSATGAGTRMVYHPAKGIFRVGYLSGTDTYQGTQWDDANLGIVTTAFGYDHLVSGNFSHAIGGASHSLGGAYATVLGGQGNAAYGDFSVAMGRGAAANNHGSFVWADAASGAFAAATQNQFLIRASGGVGINTRVTGLSIQLATKNVALTVYPKPVGAVHFLEILTDPSDWASAAAIVDGLKAQGHLLPSGEMAGAFNHDAVLSLPPGFAYAHLEPQIRAILALHNQNLVLNMVGGTAQALVYTQHGGLGIKTTTPTGNALVVMDTLQLNAPGNAQFVVHGASLGAPLFLTVGTENPVSSPSFVVSASGNVGVGKFPDLLVNGQAVVSSADPAYGYLDSVGSISAEAFIFPDGQQLSASTSVLVWSYINTTPNIYFPSANVNAYGRIAAVGNVGIGTSSPNSLLEISNRSSLQSLVGTSVSPVITFDLDGTDRYTFGVSRTQTDVFRIGPGGSASIGEGSPFAVLNNRVGIAITRPLTAALSVGGNALMGRLQIGTANLGATTHVAVTSVNANKFLVDNQLVDWIPINRDNRTTDVFYDTIFDPQAIPPLYSYVGIGTTQPQYSLDIIGTLNIVASANAPAIVMDNFIVEGDYYAQQLNLSDIQAGSIGELMVFNKELVLDTTDSVINISKVFTLGEGPGGYVGMWRVDAGVPSFSIFAPTNMYWVSATPTAAGILRVTANTEVEKYSRYSDSFSASNNISFGAGELSTMVRVQSVVSHDGVLANSRSHDAASLNVLIQTWPANPSDWQGVTPPMEIAGLNIHMKNLPYKNSPTYFSSKARAVGLHVDVSDVTLQQFTDPGYRYPAIFMGGDIGIGGTPNAQLGVSGNLLEVYGTLRAQAFNISEGLKISTINVLNAIYINAPGRVGIGTETPKTALDIKGDIQSIGMVAPMRAETLSAGGTLTIGTNGYVGMGISNPTAQWMLQKQFQSLPSSDFSFQIIDVEVGDNNVAKPLIGTYVALSSNSGNNYTNQLGDKDGIKRVVGTGYKVDLSGLNVPTGGVVVGLSATASSNRDTSRRVAVFMGGNVGIGTTTPAYPLEVAGTIYATNAPAASFLTEQEVASFSMLNVANNVKVTQGGHFQDLYVTTLRQDNLRLQGTLSIPEQSLVVGDRLFAQSFVSVNAMATLNAVTVVSTAGLQSVSVNKMAVGGVLSSEALRVYGTFTASSLNSTAGEIKVARLGVNDQTFVITEASRAGFGTASPASSVHMKTESYRLTNTDAVAVASDYRTWNPLILQASVATPGHAVGLVLLSNFDESGPSGAGVLGVKTFASGTDAASALAFVTDPEGGEAYPQERLRITDAGWVGIGTTLPTASLHVKGSVFSTAMTLPTASMFVNAMAGTNVTFSITTNVTSLLVLDRLRTPYLRIFPSGVTSISSDNGNLFVDSITKELFYEVKKNGFSVQGNLSVTSSVLPETVPYFKGNGSMAGVSFIKWATENTVGVLRITTSNEVTYSEGSRFAVIGLVSLNITEGKALQSIRLGFKDRSTPGSARFFGMDLALAGISYVHDRFVGLSVTVSDNLRTKTTLSNGTVVTGSAFAAAFLVGTESSGNVGVISGSDSDMVPSASLHIVAGRTHTPLWVQKKVDSVWLDALFVSSNAFVGMGTASPNSQLSVAATTDRAAMTLFSAAGASVLSVNNTGVGIGTSQPGQALSVVGTLSAPMTSFGGLQSSSLSVNTDNSGLLVSSLGEVMLGTTTPLGQFTMVRQFTTSAAMPLHFPMQDIRQTLNSTRTHNLTGIEVVVSTDASAIFEGSAGSKLARGMVLDLKDIVAITGNPVMGVYVDMGISKTAGAGRYAATFLGGNVGMGVSQPNVALDINGSIRANSLIASGGEWTLSAITTNAFFGGDARITTFNINNRNPMSLEVLSTLEIDGNTTVNIQSVQDANQFDAKVLHSVLGTANVVFVGAHSGFADNTVLGVSGSGLLGSLTVPTVTISSAITGETLTVNSPLVISANRVTHTGAIGMTYLQMAPVATQNPSAYTPYTTLFVSSQNAFADQALIFRNPNTGVMANVSSAILGVANRVAGYNENRRVSDQPFMTYTVRESSLGVTYSVLRVGTANATIASGNGVLGLYTGYGVTTGLGDVRAARISTGMGPRITPSSAVFTGVGVGLVGNGTPLGMAPGEVAGGVYVDMQSLRATMTLPNGDAVVGTKIAAIFRSGLQTSGNVGIHTGEDLGTSFLLSANLHVVSALTNPLWIQTASRTAMGSDGLGYLSVGEPIPSAKLSVKGYSDADAFALMAGTTQVMTGGDLGVAIGQLPNAAAWSVAGTASANQAGLGELVSGALQLGTSVAITSAGHLGIGSLLPDHALTIAKNIALPEQLTQNYTQRVVSMNLGKNGSISSVFVPFIGYEMSFAADGILGQFGTGVTPVEAVGLWVDLGDLQLGSNGVAYGIAVTMGHDAISTSRNPLVLLGGNVGIGTTAPATALAVSGVITGKDAVINTVSVNATSATFNRLVLPLGQSATLNTMTIIASGVDLEVLDTLRFDNTSGVTLNFQDHVSTQKEWTSEGLIADVATFNTLFIPQKPVGLATSFALWVSQNALFRHDLHIASMNNKYLSVNALMSTDDMFLPTLNIGLTNGLANVLTITTGNLKVGQSVYMTPISSSSVLSNQSLSGLVLLNDVMVADHIVPHYKYTNGEDRRNVPLLRMFHNYGSDRPPTMNMVMYGTDGIIAKNDGMWWEQDTTTGNHVHVVSTMVDQSKYSLGISASLNTTAFASGYSANKVTMGFGPRTGNRSSLFIGTHVVLDGVVTSNETAIGVRVDLSQLESESSTLLPLNEDFAVDGFKASAVFLAENNGDTQGTMGVFTLMDLGTSPTPDATLHVGSTVTANANVGPFLVGVLATPNALIVTVTSNVGLWTASGEAQLEITRLLVHATGDMGLLVRNAAQSPILTALQTGSVGIGSTEAIASLNVVHSASTGHALWIDNPTTSNPFVVTGAGRTGLGNTAPTAMFDMTFDKAKFTFPVDVVWTVSSQIDEGGGRWRYSLLGTYQIGGVSYTYGVIPRTNNTDVTSALKPVGSVWNGSTEIVDFISTNTTQTTGGAGPLRVAAANGVSLVVGQEGKLGIWRRSPTESYMAMAVSGSMTAGDDTTWTNVPKWLDNPPYPVIYPQLHGYAVRQSGDFSFVGHYRESAAVSADGVVMWGKDAGDVLLVKDVNQTELLRFGKTRVGVVSSDPQATLSIGATDISQYPFRVSTLVSPNAMTMDTAGKVGLGTLVPSQDLHVIGDFNISTGNPLTAGFVSSNYMALKSLSLGVLYATPPEFKETLPIHNVVMTLAAYSKDTHVTGLGYRLTSENAYTMAALANPNSQAVKVNGLVVDVTGLAIEEYATNKFGYKAAAVFMGGPMVIGHATVDDVAVISTANIAFQAYGMDRDGRRIATGNILKIKTTSPAGSGREMVLNYLGNEAVHHEVTPLAFTAIQGTDDTASAVMADALIEAGDMVKTTKGAYARRSGNIATANVNVKAILEQAKTKASVVFHVARGGNQDSFLYLMSGHNASTVTTSMVSAVGVGHVGIGFPMGNAHLAAIDRPFVVSGDVQLGVKTTSFFTSPAGWGAKAYFSGGRIYSPDGNSDNTHEYFMGRYNRSNAISELRINIGETSTTSPNPSSKLIVDTYPKKSSFVAANLVNWGEGTSLKTGFTVSVFGYVNPNDTTVLTELPIRAGVGIGTTSPAAGLHVVRRSEAEGGPSMTGIDPRTPFSHTVLIVSKGSSQNMALVNYGTATDANFMTFIHKDTTKVRTLGYKPTVLGSIEMDGFGGVQFASPEADYAEYLPKISAENLRPGDVVGVFNGQVSRATAGARSVRVISSRPIVAGNFPGLEQLNAFGLVAFMGQVPVRVRGVVRAGDYLIASGFQDGTAVAITASLVVNPAQIIGQAWTATDAAGESTVNAIVGMSFANKHIGARLGEVVSLRAEVAGIKTELSVLETYLQTKYEERQAKIAVLRKR